MSEKALYIPKVLEIVNLVAKEGEILCSYVLLGICEAIFGGRDLIFCVELHISTHFSDIKSTIPKNA